MKVFPIPEFLIVTAVSLLLCAIGFKRFVWFMSVGYGVSSAGIGLTLLILSIVNKSIGLGYAMQCILFVIYGVRLGGFLLIRELKNASYKSKLDEIGANAKPPIFVSLFMWLFCGVLYVCQAAGLFYRFTNGYSTSYDVLGYVGIIISIIGIIIEATADKQKSAQKKTNPNMPAMQGLFKLCRCPNYFGEILFWTGCFVSGIKVFAGLQWIIAIIGYCAIVFIMLSGAKRLEKRHIKNYGDKKEYNDYADHTPILIPFVPIYHVVKASEVEKK